MLTTVRRQYFVPDRTNVRVWFSLGNNNLYERAFKDWAVDDIFRAYLKREPAETLCTTADSRPKRLKLIKNWLAFVCVCKGRREFEIFFFYERRLASEAFPILGSGCSLFECIPRPSPMALEEYRSGYANTDCDTSLHLFCSH